MRVDGNGREPLGGGHIAQMTAEAALIDGEIVIEGEQHGRNDTVRNVVRMSGHFSYSSKRRDEIAGARVGLLPLPVSLTGRGRRPRRAAPPRIMSSQASQLISALDRHFPVVDSDTLA